MQNDKLHMWIVEDKQNIPTSFQKKVSTGPYLLLKMRDGVIEVITNRHLLVTAAAGCHSNLNTLHNSSLLSLIRNVS